LKKENNFFEPEKIVASKTYFLMQTNNFLLYYLAHSIGLSGFVDWMSAVSIGQPVVK
jgi:hypothetical protein